MEFIFGDVKIKMNVTDLVNDNVLKVSDAAKRMNMTEEEFMKSMKAELSRR